MLRKGTGYAAAFYGTGYGNGFPDESRAEVKLTKDGIFELYVEVSEVGSGGISIMLQIACDTLDANEKCIKIINTNSSLVQDSGTAAASRQTYNTGNAVLDCCKKLKKVIDIALEGNNQGNTNQYKLRNLYSILIQKNLDTNAKGYFKANTSRIDAQSGQGDPYWPYTFGVQKATVEVDDETGKVNIIEIVTVNDAGKIINPVLAEGQAIGGCAMGIGYGIMEEVKVNNGEIKNKNFSDYLIPTSKDIPEIKSYFVEEYEASGPYGAKGLGEPVMLPTAPAILNAIYDAVGVRIHDLPATPDKVLLAIKNNRNLF